MTSQLSAALVNTTAEIGHHGCTIVCRQIAELSEGAGLRIARWLSLAAEPRSLDWNSFDLILLNGEGSLHHDRAAAQRIARWADFAETVGKPAYLINSVYEANGVDVAQSVRRFRMRYVREPLSQDELRRAGVHSVVVPDLSLTWRGMLTPAGTKLVVTDAVGRDETLALLQLAQAHQAPFATLITRPPIIGDYPDHNLRRIVKYHWRRITAAVRSSPAARARMRHAHPTFEAFTGWLAREAGLIVTGRFHAACMAIDMEIPFLALESNTHKIRGMLSDLGMEHRLIQSIAALDRLRGLAPAHFAFSRDELARLRAYRASALQRAEAMFSSIAGDARASGRQG